MGSGGLRGGRSVRSASFRLGSIPFFIPLMDRLCTLRVWHVACRVYVGCWQVVSCVVRQGFIHSSCFAVPYWLCISFRSLQLRTPPVLQYLGCCDAVRCCMFAVVAMNCFAQCESLYVPLYIFAFLFLGQ